MMNERLEFDVQTIFTNHLSIFGRTRRIIRSKSDNDQSLTKKKLVHCIHLVDKINQWKTILYIRNIHWKDICTCTLYIQRSRVRISQYKAHSISLINLFPTSVCIYSKYNVQLYHRQRSKPTKNWWIPVDQVT